MKAVCSNIMVKTDTRPKPGCARLILLSTILVPAIFFFWFRMTVNLKKKPEINTAGRLVQLKTGFPNIYEAVR